MTPSKSETIWSIDAGAALFGAISTGETVGFGDVDYPEKRSFRRDSMSTFW